MIDPWATSPGTFSRSLERGARRRPGFGPPLRGRAWLSWVASCCLGLAVLGPGCVQAGSGPLGIDSELALDQKGIWARKYQTGLESGVIAVEVAGALWFGNDNPLGHTFWQTIDATTVSAIGRSCSNMRSAGPARAKVAIRINGSRADAVKAFRAVKSLSRRASSLLSSSITHAIIPGYGRSNCCPPMMPWRASKAGHTGRRMSSRAACWARRLVIGQRPVGRRSPFRCCRTGCRWDSASGFDLRYGRVLEAAGARPGVKPGLAVTHWLFRLTSSRVADPSTIPKFAGSCLGRPHPCWRPPPSH